MLKLLNHKTKGREAPDDAKNNRRVHDRHGGGALRIECEGRALRVEDVSVGGLRVGGLNRNVGDTVRMVLILDSAPGIAADCRVVTCDDQVAHLEFTRPTLPLLRMIISHISQMTGVKPHLLKKV